MVTWQVIYTLTTAQKITLASMVLFNKTRNFYFSAPVSMGTKWLPNDGIFSTFDDRKTLENIVWLLVTWHGLLCFSWYSPQSIYKIQFLFMCFTLHLKNNEWNDIFLHIHNCGHMTRQSWGLHPSGCDSPLERYLPTYQHYRWCMGLVGGLHLSVDRWDKNAHC